MIAFTALLGTNLQTGEEVGIKMVCLVSRVPWLSRGRALLLFGLGCGQISIKASSQAAVSPPTTMHWRQCCMLVLLLPLRFVLLPHPAIPSAPAPRRLYRQESLKARHPQLLYESKLYNILQGGGAICAREMRSRPPGTAAAAALCSVAHATANPLCCLRVSWCLGDKSLVRTPAP